MRRKEKEIIDRKIIEEILSKSDICRVAMVDDMSQPYIVPLNFGYRNNTIYIHSAPAGRKIEILKQNNRVCFEIEYKPEIIKEGLACDWGTKYRSLIGQGTVEIITERNDKKKGLDIIMEHHGMSGNIVYKEKQVDAMVILKLNIEELSGKQSGDWQ